MKHVVVYLQKKKMAWYVNKNASNFGTLKDNTHDSPTIYITGSNSFNPKMRRNNIKT